MKKNISINISGIIFHIEEDVFDRLKQYLDSIYKYFSSFEDSKEITDDIESRIAEILLSKLSEGNQVITGEMIAELKKTMGTVADFQATLEQEDPEPQAESTQKETKEEQNASNEPKRLHRNDKNKVFGGVASGMADYFNVDPIWIRLIFLALFFNLVFAAVSGAIFLAYIVLWVVLPVNKESIDDKGIKKLYRNASDRVLGGVAGGIAAFFGVDVTVIRVLFIISIFAGGAGIILYLILWIITPEAKTITEKMQMQGEPVTLSNIESNVKKTLNMDKKEENVLIKVILFPFRLIALILNGISKLLGPLVKIIVDIFRIVFGLITMLVGLLLMFVFLVVFVALLGAGTATALPGFMTDFPLDLFMDAFTIPALVSVFLVLFIPALLLAFAGLVIMIQRKIGNSYMGWVFFGLWIIGLIGVAFFGPRTIKEFRSEGTHTEERIYAMEKQGSIPTLKLADEMMYINYEAVRLKLRGHEDTTFKLVINYESRGSSRSTARENAASVKYPVEYVAGDFYFSSELDFTDTPFRFQQAEATMYIPYGQVFRMDRELREILINTLHLKGYRASQMEGNDWVFEPNGLKCITCQDGYSDTFYEPSGIDLSFRQTDWDKLGGEERTFDFTGFSTVQIEDYLNVYIKKSEKYSVILKGDNLDDVFLRMSGNRLRANNKTDYNIFQKRNFKDSRMSILITMPEVKEVELSGASLGSLSGFDNDMEIILSGASEMKADLDLSEISLKVSGASKLILTGKGDYLDVNMSGASTLEAFDFSASKTNLTISGASSAKVVGKDELTIDAGGVSNVRYKDSPNVKTKSDRLSTVKGN